MISFSESMLTAPEHLLVIHVDRGGLHNEAVNPLSRDCEAKCADVAMVCNHLETVSFQTDVGNPTIYLQRSAIRL